MELNIIPVLKAVRAAWDSGTLKEKIGECVYSAPCAIGAAMTPEQLAQFVRDPDLDAKNISTLIEMGLVTSDHPCSLIRLQSSFDNGTQVSFARHLASLEQEFLP